LFTQYTTAGVLCAIAAGAAAKLNAIKMDKT